MARMHRADFRSASIGLGLLSLAAPAFAQEDGAFKLNPSGFLSFTAVARSTNTGSNLPTGFGSIPYNNTISGNLGEVRFSSADTRLGLKTGGSLGDIKVKALVEGDFLGSDPANAYVSTNGHPFRLRLAYADLFMGNWEILAGQAFSWLTPNRKGLSADPSDLFTTLSVDPNNHVGLVWGRSAQIRVAYHPSEAFAIGLALENPEQYVGAGEVIFPFAFNAQLGVQVDAANNLSTPNQMPDIVLKGAVDTGPLHIEVVGLHRQFEIQYLQVGSAGNGWDRAKAYGDSGALNFNLQLFDGFRFIGNAFTGTGGGRYIFGLGPDFVVEPYTSTGGATTQYWVALHAVRSSALLGGLEWQLDANNLAAIYYGMAKFENRAFQDVTSPLATKPYIGFGGYNSPNSANKMIREYTLDYQHTFWSKPGKGALKWLLQASHVSREPWFVAAGAPPKADVNMYYASLRYILPS